MNNTQHTPWRPTPENMFADLQLQGFMRRKKDKKVIKYEVIVPEVGLVYHGESRWAAEQVAASEGGKVTVVRQL